MSARSQHPTDAELEILKILWSLGPATVRQVHDQLGLERDVGYTTVLKTMQIMHGKGLLTRDDAGRAHVYAAAEDQDAVQRSLVKEFMARVFEGSAGRLVIQALSSSPESLEDIEEIQRLIDEARRRGP